MRGATQCAAKLTQLTRSLRTKLGKVTHPATGDPVTQMILGIFSRDLPESKAREAIDRLRGMVVDYNELRVIPPIELAEMIGDIPDARLKCEDLSRALNRVFALEHEISLDRLRSMSKKDCIDYLEKIHGLEAYSRARVRLLGLNLHAIPLDEAMWAFARREGVIDAKCTLEEAQSFLERRVPDGEALDVTALLHAQAWAEMGAAVRKGEVERIASVPPDRTTRNLLQLVAAGRPIDFDDTSGMDDLESGDEGEMPLHDLEVDATEQPAEAENAESSAEDETPSSGRKDSKSKSKSKGKGKEKKAKGKSAAETKPKAAPSKAAASGKKTKKPAKRASSHARAKKAKSA